MNQTEDAIQEFSGISSNARGSIFSFSGLAQRTEYFGITAATFVTVALLGYLLEANPTSRLFPAITLLLLIPGIWLNAAAGVRRCHDLGHSGWLYALSAIPLINLMFVGYLLLGPSKSAMPDSQHGRRAPVKSSRLCEHPDSGTDEASLYDEIAAELENNTTNRGLWTKAFALADGDENKAKAHYIKLRVEQDRGAHPRASCETMAPVSAPSSLPQLGQSRPLVWLWMVPTLLLVVGVVTLSMSNNTESAAPAAMAEQLPDLPRQAPMPVPVVQTERQSSKNPAAWPTEFAGIRFDITPEELMGMGFGCSHEGICRNVGGNARFEGFNVGEFHVRFIGRNLRAINITFANEKMPNRKQLLAMEAAVDKRFTTKSRRASEETVLHDWTVKNNAEISLFASSINLGKRYYTVFEYVDSNVKD